MKVGMNLFLWTTTPTDEKWLPLYERLKKMGFDGIELPIFNDDIKSFQALGRRLDDMGLLRTAVTARMPEDNPISPDSKMRALAIAKNRAAVECAQAAGATLLGGPFYAGLGAFTGKAPTADEWKWGVDSMIPVAELAATCKVTLALEFLNRFETHLLNCTVDTQRFTREVNRPGCKILYDTFHAHIEEKSIATAFETGASDFVHIHISENDRSTPGKGQVNWKETFRMIRKINYDGWLTIEAFGQSLPDLMAATKIWRRMFGNEEQLAQEGHDFIRKMWAETA